MARTYRRGKKTPRWILKETDEEFIKRYWGSKKRLITRYHSDAWDIRNAGKYYKRVWAKNRRAWDKQEIAKTATIGEYEPTWFTTKIDTWLWD